MSVCCRILLALTLAVSVLWANVPARAASHADFRADIQLKVGDKAARIAGTAQAAGDSARMDVHLGKAGDFAIIADGNARMLKVLSLRLKAYVEVPVSGDARSWRDLMQSAVSAVVPQSMGMINLQEKERTSLGKTSWEGYTVTRSRSVFEVSFMGRIRNFTLEVWENSVFSPFPMRVLAEETRETYGGSASLVHIAAEQSPASEFAVPSDYTRYSSIMDLLLYALTAF